jgi:hypothetical protein
MIVSFAILTSCRAHNTTFAKVVVGPKAQSFTVHLDLLVYHSPFFRAALTGSFKEAGEKLITLSDTNENTFELFIHWLYYQRFPTDIDSPQLLALYHSGKGSDDQFRSLVNLYIFCDKYNVPGLKRQCLDTLFQHVVDGPDLPPLADIGHAFDNLEDNDPLCRMFIEAYCYYDDGDSWMAEYVQDLSPVLLSKFLTEYSKYIHGGRDSYAEPELCDYHHHTKTEDRKVCEDQREKAEQARGQLMG